MAVKIGINGIGRIGKLVLRHSFDDPNLEVVAVNDLMSIDTLAYLLKYDTVHRTFSREIEVADPNTLLVNGKRVAFHSAPEPKVIPWEEHNAEYIIESSGHFTSYAQLEAHLKPGIHRVILSCPAGDKVDKTIVLGVNEDILTKKDRIISNASCTTNCIAPVLKILNNTFGFEKGFMNTVHPFTNNQSLTDGPHNDLRRARAAATNIIPTTSTAIKAVCDVLPLMKCKLDGFATRVPVADGAFVELVAELSSDTSVEELNYTFKKASETYLKNILAYTEDPIVSSDIINDPHSAIFDALSTKVIDKRMIQILVWYDNEYA